MIILFFLAIFLFCGLIAFGECYYERDWPRHTGRFALIAGILFVLSLSAFGQNVRWDLPITTVQAQGGNLLPVYAIPGAGIKFYSCSGSTCTTLATTYISATSSTTCPVSPTPMQVTLNGSSTCVSSADPYGNMGAWFQQGQYMATITAQGSSYNYFFTISTSASSDPCGTFPFGLNCGGTGATTPQGAAGNLGIPGPVVNVLGSGATGAARRVTDFNVSGSTGTSATANFTSADTGSIALGLWGATGVVSGTYTSGITATGHEGQYCNLAFTGGGGSGATAQIYLTSTNTIITAQPLISFANGSNYTSAPTAASVSSGTATCTGPAVVSTVIGGALAQATLTYVNSTTVTLSAPAITLVSTGTLDWGPNDCAAITSAVGSWNGGGKSGLFFPAGRYMVGNSCHLSVSALGNVFGAGQCSEDSGQCAASIVSGDLTGNLFTFTGETNRVYDLGFVNPGYATSGSFLLANSSYSKQQMNVDHVSTSGSYCAIDENVGALWTVSNSLIQNYSRCGLHVNNALNEDAGNSLASGNKIYNNIASSAYAGIFMEGGGGFATASNFIQSGFTQGHLYGFALQCSSGGCGTSELFLNHDTIDIAVSSPIYLDGGNGAFPFNAIAIHPAELYSAFVIADVYAHDAVGINVGGGYIDNLGGAPRIVFDGPVAQGVITPFAFNGAYPQQNSLGCVPQIGVCEDLSQLPNLFFGPGNLQIGANSTTGYWIQYFGNTDFGFSLNAFNTSGTWTATQATAQTTETDPAGFVWTWDTGLTPGTFTPTKRMVYNPAIGAGMWQFSPNLFAGNLTTGNGIYLSQDTATDNFLGFNAYWNGSCDFATSTEASSVEDLSGTIDFFADTALTANSCFSHTLRASISPAGNFNLLSGAYEIAGSPIATGNLADWTDSGVANGNVPVWNSGTGKWTPGSSSGITLTTTGSSGAATLTGSVLNIPVYSGGGGSGTVTSFSAGTLSPLFTTSVATSTTTPALTFALTNAAQNSVFAGPASGGAGAPSYQTAPTIAVTNMTGTGGFNTTGNASTATLATGATNIAGGVANDIPYQTAASTTSFVTPVNSAVLVSSSGGVPSESTTLPSGLTIPGYAPALVACSDENSTFTPANSSCYFVTASVSTATPAASAFVIFTITTSSAGTMALTGTTIADGGGCSSYISGTTLTLTSSQTVSVKSDGTTIRASCTAAPGSGTVTDGAGSSTANQLAVATATPHVQAYVTTLPAAAIPSAIPIADVGSAGLSGSGGVSIASTGAISLSGIPLTALATQATNTVVMNGTAGTAAPTAVVMPTCTSGADLYNTTTSAWSCVSTGGGTPAYPLTITGGVSGGVVYGSLSTQLTVSPAGTANVLMKWGGAATAPGNSSVTDNGTTVTTTDTGGYVGPVFTANGTTAGFADYPQGTTSAAVAPCNVANSICLQAPTSVTSQLRVFAGAPATGLPLYTNSSGTMTETILPLTGSGPNVQSALIAGAPTYTAGASVTSCVQATGYTNSNERGEVTIVGGTATTGTICTVNFSTTLASAPGMCQVTQNGGTTVFSIGHGTPGTSSFTITSGISVVSSTLNVDYDCTP